MPLTILASAKTGFSQVSRTSADHGSQDASFGEDVQEVFAHQRFIGTDRRTAKPGRFKTRR